MDRRNLLLREMGITHWQLHRPETLQGVVEISVSPQIRLIVISDDNFGQSSLFNDVLLSLNMSKEACLCINYDQAQHLEVNQPVGYWLLSENAEQIDRTLPYCHAAERVYRSPAWATFQSSSHAKREFWQQVQQV